MAGYVGASRTNSGPARRGLTEPALVRWVLTAIALAFLGLFLVVPLVAVFAEAFSKGVQAYLAAVNEPDVVGTPAMTPVALLRATPGGSEPDDTDQSTEPTWPADVMTLWIGSPTRPVAEDGIVAVKGVG